ncbi:MAG: hypothetical protein O2809_11480 [Proteobacteria bacterium]|nr:hypothetical protein [Pseudomonadota bacterium]
MREQKYYDELINGIDEAVEHSMSEVKRFADTYNKEESYYYGRRKPIQANTQQTLR